MPDGSHPGNPLGLEPIDSAEAHVFISYSRQDLDFVGRLARALQVKGINIWIDKLGLQAGTPDWEQTLRDAIGGARAVLLVASESSRRSRYVRDELAIAEMHGTPVYPIWAVGDKWIESIPMGMGRVQFIDARAEKFDNAVIEAAQALKGLMPNLAVMTTLPRPAQEAPQNVLLQLRNPFKGLNAFRSEDRADFFGRDTLIQEMTDTLKAFPGFLSVIGASGSGKSSVVMAGLLPQLEEGSIPGSESWIYLTPFTPTDQPLERLAEVLEQKLPAKSGAAIRDDLVHPSALGAYRLARQISNLTPKTRVVLYVDQLEELFTQVRDEEVRARFVHLLTTGVSEPNSPLTIIMTMRADFYDRPLAYVALASLIQDHQVLVQPMSLAELNAAVTQPAAAAGLTFDEGLVADLVYEVRDQPGALPLLQFTLDQLYQQREDRRLTRAAYEGIGRVKGALANHAEAAYTHLSSDDHRTLARSLFLRLIDPGVTESDTTRRRAHLSELTSANLAQMTLMRQVLDAFVKNRLLITDRRNDIETVEISHEALIREWPRLREWLTTMRSDIELQQTLSADANDWIKRERAADRLYRGSALKEAYEWSMRSLPSADEVSFIDASRTEEVRLERVEQHRQRTVRRFQFAAIILLIVVIGIIGLSAIQQAQSNKLLESANQQLEAALATQAQFVVSADNYRQQGKAYLVAGRYAEAVAEFTRLIAVDEPRVNNFLNRAVANMAIGNYLAADRDYQVALNLNSGDPGILNDYGVALAAQGQWEAALDSYQKALALTPDQMQTLTNVGVIYAAQRYFDKAEAQYHLALDSAPNFVPARENQFALQILRNNSHSYFRLLIPNVMVCRELPNTELGIDGNCSEVIFGRGTVLKADPKTRVAVNSDIYVQHDTGWSRERRVDATEVDMIELAMDDRLVTSASTLVYSAASLAGTTQESSPSDCYALSQSAADVRVRSEPDLSGEVIAQAEYHQPFLVEEALLNTSDGFVWLHVVQPNSGQSGWTRSDFYGWTGSCQKVGLPDHLFPGPLVNGWWVGGYGPNGTTSRTGWDFSAQVGEPVHAATTGGVVARIYYCTVCTVERPNTISYGIPLSDASVFANPAWGYGYGNAVIVRYDWDELPVYGQQALREVGLQDTSIQCIYGHLAEIDVDQGQVLTPGEQIGTVGNTGSSSGPHLSLDCRAVRGDDIFSPADPSRRWINPEWFFNRLGAYSSESISALLALPQLGVVSETATPDGVATATAFFARNGGTAVPTVSRVPTATMTSIPLEPAGQASLGKNNGHITLDSGQMWTFKGAPGGVISIYTESEMDTYLRVADSSGSELATNDDEEQLLHYYNSLVTVALPDDGAINIEIRSKDEGEYVLNIQEGVYAPALTPTPVQLGAAQLGENIAHLSIGGTQIWTFNGKPGHLYWIDVSSDQLDYYYGIFETKTHHYIEMTGLGVYIAPSDGRFSIEVVAEHRESEGDYVLFIAEVEPTPTIVFATLTPFFRPTPISS